MNLTKALLLSLLIVMPAACSVQSTDGGTKPGEATGFMGSKKDELDVQTGDAFKGLNQVVIGSFNVGFLQYKKAAAKAGGGLLGSGMGGKSSAKMTLIGLDDATMQAVTDAAYADFLKQLKAKGYTVADRSQLLNSEEFKGVSKQNAPYKKEASLFGSDTSMAYFVPKALGTDLYIFQREAGETGGFAFANPAVAAAGWAGKNKIPVLNVTYLLDFANAEGFGGWWRSSSSVSVGQGISIPPGQGLYIIGGEGGTFSTAIGSIKLGQAVYSTDTFGEMVGTTSDVEKGAEVAVNIATGLLGGGSNISRSFDLKANPAKYKKVAGKVLDEANTKLVDKMAALK